MKRDNRAGRRWAGAAFLAVLPALDGSATAADLNGFLREKGKGDVALSYTAERYDEFWAGDDKVSDPGVGEVDTRTVSLWLAYGVTDRLTLVAQLPYVNAEGDGTGGFEESDLQDATTLAIYRMASFGGSARSTFVGAFGLRTIASNYQANSPVDVGDGTADWLFRVIYQLTWRRMYVSQQIGFDLRSGDAPDGFPLYTEVGATWGPVTYNLFYSRLSAEDGTDIMDPGFTFPSNEEEYQRIGGKVFGRINDHFGVSGAYFTTLDGRNTGDASGVSIGVNVRY